MEARQFAAQVLEVDAIRPGDLITKEVDEAIEAALVRVARQIVYQTDTPQATYQKLIELYDRQPNLNVRTSTSISQQAYSTPLPLAYLATQLAEVEPGHSVYEPTAGHGALLLSSAPGFRPTVNELNPERAADLRAQGYDVTEADALQYVPRQPHDAVLMNPPFGVLKDGEGNNRNFYFPEHAPYRTTQIDQAIALKGLKAMKPEGKAVLILGGKLGVDEEKRSDRYNTQESRGFFYTLYQNYNVVDHFSVWGDLYKKQGAGFPIDVIVIHGKGKSARPLPAAEVPRLYRTYDELGELLDVERRRTYQQPERLRAGGGREDSGGAGARNGNQPQRTTLPGTAHRASGATDAVMGSGGWNLGNATPAGNGNQVLEAARTAPQMPQTRTVGGMGAVSGTAQQSDSSTPGQTGRDLSGERGTESQPNRVAEGIVRGTGHSAEPGGMAGRSDVRPEPESVPAIAPPKQAPYNPQSQGDPLGTLVPVNMQTALSRALLSLSRKVGSLDAFVADRLGYGRPETLHKHFKAEQIDALALAINNVERGSGMILGDQTGIGKGRVVAGMLRYAKITGRTPIFVTRDTPLYADMIRDLRDIGMDGFKPLMTNSSLEIGLPDGRTLKTGGTHDQTLRALREEGSLGGFDAIFTTYHQMQTVKGKETARRAFLRQFAPGSLLVLDESHEAGGGTSERDRTGPANRADFARELVNLSQGCLYSSATYAKVPEVMTLYAKTDMRLALTNMERLTGLVSSGGIPLQQALAATLTESGQYIRRERSFEGVTFEPLIAPVNHAVAEDIAGIMADIMEFDRLKRDVVKGLDKALKSEAKKALGDNSTGGAGATSTNFTSIMHNVIDQMLLGLKAESTVQRCLQRLQQDEKPVVALSNTMGTSIQRYAEAVGLEPGEEMGLSFGDLIRRYLDRSRDIMEGSAYGQKQLRRLSDEELGPAAVAKFAEIHARIDWTDFSKLPVSPVDYILGRLRQEGYQAGEVTGREHIAQYQPDGGIVYQRRSAEERSKKTAIETVNAFNDGRLDVILLNRSGSTGISLHASEKFADQRRRRMIVAQPEADINQFMQMLGRVHRTGQVVPPAFDLVMADIPAEKRPGAVLMNKMASLSANTTAARSSGIALDVPDFLNEYGDAVIESIMRSHPDLHAQLDYPLEGWQGNTVENPAQRVTGRIPLLPLQEQERLYDLIERKYREYVAQKEALGESILEASTLNLDARTLARMEILPADAEGDSPFTGAVYAEIVDAKTPRKPFPTLAVINQVRAGLELPGVESPSQHNAKETAVRAAERVLAQAKDLRIQTRQYQATQPANRSNVIDQQLAEVTRTLERFPIGQTVRLMTAGGDTFQGVIDAAHFVGDAKTGNPAAPSSWELRILVADPAQSLSFPFSQIGSDKKNGVKLEHAKTDDKGTPIYELFDQRQSQNREKRQVITGNLLRAYEQFPGQIVNFTDMEGNLRQGLMTPREFDTEKFLTTAPVAMPTIEDAWRWVSEYDGHLQTRDLSLTIKQHKDGGFVLHTPLSKGEGGKHYLDEDLLAAAGGEFVSVNDRMERRIDEAQLDAVLTYLISERGTSLYATNRQDEARQMLGVQLPSFEPVAPAAPVSPAPTPFPGAMDYRQATAELAHRTGRAETNILKLLAQAELGEQELWEGEEFYLRVDNDPYIPLIIERHGDRLYLTHYLEQNGDHFIDSEMVFRRSKTGELNLLETAVQGLGRECRGCDRSFAAVFSRNLLEQGFGDAIKAARQQAPAVEQPKEPSGEPFEEQHEESVVQPTLLPLDDFQSKPAPAVFDPSWDEGKFSTGKPGKASKPRIPTMDEVTTWRRAVRDLGMGRAKEWQVRDLEDQLNRRAPLPVPSETTKVMSKDLERYRPFQERGKEVLSYAQLLLCNAGQPDLYNRVTFRGKIYELVQDDQKLTITRKTDKGMETILQAIGDTITRTTVTEKDLERFARVAQPYCMENFGSEHSIA